MGKRYISVIACLTVSFLVFGGCGGEQKIIDKTTENTINSGYVEIKKMVSADGKESEFLKTFSETIPSSLPDYEVARIPAPEILGYKERQLPDISGELIKLWETSEVFERPNINYLNISQSKNETFFDWDIIGENDNHIGKLDTKTGERNYYYRQKPGEYTFRNHSSFSSIFTHDYRIDVNYNPISINLFSDDDNKYPDYKKESLSYDYKYFSFYDILEYNPKNGLFVVCAKYIAAETISILYIDLKTSTILKRQDIDVIHHDIYDYEPSLKQVRVVDFSKRKEWLTSTSWIFLTAYKDFIMFSDGYYTKVFNKDFKQLYELYRGATKARNFRFIDNKMIIVTNRYKYSDIYAYDLETKETIWSVEIPNIYGHNSEFFVKEGVLVLGGEDKKHYDFYLVNYENGEKTKVSENAFTQIKDDNLNLLYDIGKGIQFLDDKIVVDDRVCFAEKSKNPGVIIPKFSVMFLAEDLAKRTDRGFRITNDWGYVQDETISILNNTTESKTFKITSEDTKYSISETVFTLAPDEQKEITVSQHFFAQGVPVSEETDIEVDFEPLKIKWEDGEKVLLVKFAPSNIFKEIN